MVTVVAGSSAGPLAGAMATRLEATLIKCDVRTFPDGESKVTLQDSPTGRCIVVQSTHPPVDANLVRLLALISEVSRTADSVVAVVPYMGYARQDREFLRGEIVTLRAVAGLIGAAGAVHTITVDMHSKMGLGYFGNATNVSAVSLLARHFNGTQLRQPLAVSPDRGGSARAAEFAAALGIPHATLDKERDRISGGVRVKSGPSGVADRDIILVDDMISTGGSMIKAAGFLRDGGCGTITAACTHALLIDDAAGRMYDAGISGVVSSNTIPGDTAIVDVSGVVADAIHQMSPPKETI